MNKNKRLEECLSVLCKGYSTGNFQDLFPLLADDCVMHSQWVWMPNEGKEAVVNYFSGKGKTLRENNVCPECVLVTLVGNINPIQNANVSINGREAQRITMGLWYEDGKPAMLMRQELDGESIEVIVDIEVNNEDMISKICLCDPILFKYRYYKTPYPKKL